MSLSPQMAIDDAGALLFTMDSNTTQSSPKAPHSPPPLPKRNARRASRFLGALLLDSAAPTTATTPTTVTATTTTTTTTTLSSATSSIRNSTASKTSHASSPTEPKTMATTTHEVYLSSEEDASSLGDISDYDDVDEYDYDSDTVEYIGAPVVLHVASTVSSASASSSASSPDVSASAPPSSTAAPPLPSSEEAAALPARRHSHEDKARLVSVVFAGKPALVDLAVERAARRLNDRATSPSPSTSSASMASARSMSRPSTSAGSAPSTGLSSMNVSPQRLQHKRNSSGSMMASFRTRKAMETIADAPASTASETAVSRPPRSYTTASSRMPPLNTAIIAATAAAAASAAPPLSSSPRTPSFGHSNLLRGVTRTLTLSRRSSRLLTKERDACLAASQPPSSASAAPPLPGQLPGVAAPATSDVSILRRKSLALSVVSLGLGSDRNDKSVPPMPQTPDEHLFTTSIAPALRRASTSAGMVLSAAPSPRVLSKKNSNGRSSPSPSASSFFSRRRSVKLL